VCYVARPTMTRLLSMARTEEVRTGDRNDNDNRIDVILSGNGDTPPKCTSVLPNSHFLLLLCQGRDNY
jgi:hypothetical protein